LRARLEVAGARLSYRQNCESMQRVHISAALGRPKVDAVRTEDVERLARALLAKGRARADPDLRFLTPTELDAVIGGDPGRRRRP
jgi:hypothetical protein